MAHQLDIVDVMTPWAVAAARGGGGAGDSDTAHTHDKQVAAKHAAGDVAHTQDKQVAAKQAADDAEFLDKMRGWLMTVATLFVGMAFQAAMHPPLWMPRDYFAQWITGRSAPDAGSSAKHDALFVFRIRDGGLTVPLFMALNTVTFGIGLVLLVTLLLMKKEPSRSDMRRITCMVRDLAISVACTFAFGISGDPVAALAVLGVFIIYPIWTWIKYRNLF